MKLFKPYEKIKSLREKYDITQEELTMGLFSRSYLSLIEKGKKKLNEQVLKVIVENFNLILKEKGINHFVEQGDIYCISNNKDRVVSSYYKIFMESNDLSDYNEILKELDEIGAQMDAIFKINLFIDLARGLSKVNEHHKVGHILLYIINEALLESESIAIDELILLLTKSLLVTEKFDILLRVYEFIYPMLNNISYSNKRIILNNVGFAYLYLGKNQSAISYFHESLSLLDDLNMNLNSYLGSIESNLNLGYYEKAKLLYDDLIDKNLSFNLQQKILIYNTGIIVAIKSNDKIMLKRIYSICNTLIRSIPRGYFLLPMINYQLGRASEKLGDKKSAYDFYIKCLTFSNLYRRTRFRYKSLSRILNLNLQYKNHEIDFFTQTYINLSKIKPNYDVGYSFIKYFLKNGNTKKIDLICKAMEKTD